MHSHTGGCGDVLERDPKLLMADIRNEIISHLTARNLYKLVYDQETVEVEYEKTEELRQWEMYNRLRQGRIYYEFVKGCGHRRPSESALKYYRSLPDVEKVREINRV